MRIFTSTSTSIILRCAALLAVMGGWQSLAQDFQVRNWRLEDGLPDGQVTAIAQTPDGYLWVGTQKGLVRFDGVRFKVFRPGSTPGLTDPQISSLATDQSGTLWVGMLDGNLARRPLHGGFAEVRPAVPLRPGAARAPVTWLWDRRTAMIEEAESRSGDPHTATGHATDYATQLTADRDGAVWWQVPGHGLMRYQAGAWTAFTGADGLPPDAIMELACDDRGRLWLAANGQARLFTGAAAQADAAAVALNGGRIALTRAAAGGLWVADAFTSWNYSAGRVRRLADGQWQEELAAMPPAPRASRAIISCMLEDRTRRLWYGTVGGGLFYYAAPGGWQRIQPRGSFSQGYISCLFEDREGNLWVGTVGDGLYRVTPQTVTMLRLPAPFETAEINTTCTTRAGAVWLGTGGSGAFRYQDGKFTAYGLANGLANLHVCSLFEDRHGTLWAGTSGGLFRLDHERFSRVAGPPELAGWVKVIHEDRAGRLWMGALENLVCLAQERFTVHHLTQGHGYGDIRSIAEDPAGSLWIGTIDQGLYRLPAGSGGRPRRVDDFPATDARALYCSPDGTLWIGGWGSGLFRLAQGRFTRFTTEDGLPSDRLHSFLPDAAGQLWVPSDNGIFQLSPQLLQGYRKGTSPPLLCPHLTLADGLANGGCSGSGQPVATRLRDGSMGFPNFEGLAVVRPQPPIGKPAPPTVLIEAVLADGSALAPVANDHWEISSGVRRLEIEYTSPNLARANRMFFRHQLAGMDFGWVDAGANRTAGYSQLPPGQYRFLVMVGGSDNQWHATDRVLHLTVIPRWWERRWLHVLAIALLVVICASGIAWGQRRRYRFRLERLKTRNALEDERRRIARDLHDDFGSTLAGLALQGEAAAQAAETTSPARAEIAAITGRIRELIGTLNEVVWATDPANDSLANVVAFLCDHTEDFLSHGGVKIRLEVPPRPELPDVTVSAHARQNLLLAAKEALNNCVRHAAASTVWLKIRLASGNFIVEIADDGCGFDPTTARPGGRGLTNITGRMQDVRGSAAIRSQPGGGTTVTLTMRLASIAGPTPQPPHSIP